MATDWSGRKYRVLKSLGENIDMIFGVYQPASDQMQWFLHSHTKHIPTAAYETLLDDGRTRMAELEEETVQWCREMLTMSPLALRMIKASMNAADDGLAGIQQLAGDATLLFYMSEEAQEGRNAYVEKRTPDFDQFPKRP